MGRSEPSCRRPVIAFLRLGLLAGVVHSDLKVRGSSARALSIFLLLAIGMKGGVG